MIRPEKIAAAKLRGNRMEIMLDRGCVRITPYGGSILHWAYFPDKPAELPMWGIDGTPDEGVCAQLREEADRYVYSIPGLGVSVSKSRFEMRFIDGAGAALTTLRCVEMEPATVLSEETFYLRAEFTAAEGEKYFGLGQHQDGKLNLEGREQVLWHDYSHKGGEIVAVPFLVTNRKYGVLFENASRMKVTPGTAGRTVWEAEVGEAVSFFVLGAQETDGLYEAYRRLCGETPLPPRAGLGFIQCKQRYASQAELIEVAAKYRQKGYPCDILVVDWFHWKTLGDMSLDEKYWPDCASMNRELEKMGYEVMISCWPRFMKECDYYDDLEEKGWFMKDEAGRTVYGTPQDRRGALIDTTNPECGRWYFDTIRKNYGELGFRYWWTDEDEPDISPHDSYLHAGTGARVHNIYPLTHTKCIYEGHREAYPHRCLTLSRAAFPGAQKYGTTFWSSDIFPEWDVLKRQIPTALNFCASGMPYWSSDIGGWQALPDEDSDEDYGSLLIGTASSGKGAVTKKEYTELYIRWFQFGVFCPTFRTHGTRKNNEVWSYGEEAERILARYLRLRYRLMPYIYSLAYHTYRSGAPFMRALWMDFEEAVCGEIEDEFMFGPSLLIAPVTERGAVSRKVYLPGGTGWIDFWTCERLEGGRTVTAFAPIDRIPVYVKEGAILPMGEETPHAKEEQKDIQICLYPGADGAFSLYSDDGQSYAYESGAYSLIDLRWNDAKKELTADGKALSQVRDGKKYSVAIMR